MVKVANTIFDIYDDHNGTVLKRLDDAGELTKVAGCTLSNQDELDALRDDQYGLVMLRSDGTKLRKYALHNPDNVALSVAYFNTLKTSMHPELAARTEAKLANPTSSKVNLVDLNHIEPVAKVAAPTEQVYGITINDKPYFPLHTPAHVFIAHEKFAEVAPQLEPQQRFVLAQNIVHQARQLKCAKVTPPEMLDYTNEDVNPYSLHSAISAREATVGRDCPELHALKAVKHAQLIVQTLQNFDAVNDIKPAKYGSYLKDPYAAVFTKCAKFVKQSYAIPEEKLSTMFDADFVSDYKENPEAVYKASPDPIKAALKKMLDENQRQEDACVLAYSGDACTATNPMLANETIA